MRKLIVIRCGTQWMISIVQSTFETTKILNSFSCWFRALCAFFFLTEVVIWYFYGLVLFVSHVILAENCLTLPITRPAQLIMALICYVFISDSVNIWMSFILWLSYVLTKKHIFVISEMIGEQTGDIFRGGEDNR